MAASPAVDDAPDLLDERLGHEAARHPPLVGDHHDGEAGAAQETHRIQTPRKQRQALQAVEIADVLVQRAVAVEKDRGSHLRPGATGLLHPTAERHPQAAGRTDTSVRVTRLLHTCCEIDTFSIK